MGLGFDQEKNRRERLVFVREYAQWVGRVPNEVWSREQADLIDAFLANAGSYALSRCAGLSRNGGAPDLRGPQRPRGGVLRGGEAGRGHLAARRWGQPELCALSCEGAARVAIEYPAKERWSLPQRKG